MNQGSQDCHPSEQCSLIKKGDLALYIQSLFRFGVIVSVDMLKKRRDWHAAALRRRRQAGKAPCAIGIDAKSCSEFRAKRSCYSSIHPSPAGIIATHGFDEQMFGPE